MSEEEKKDPWPGGDPRIEVLARVTFEHARGPCELVAAVNREAGLFGVSATTYDKYCTYPHDPVSFVATGKTIFEACLEVYYYRRQDDQKLNLRLEQVEASPPSLAREMTLGLSSLQERVQQLWIPFEHVERLYQEATARFAEPLPTRPTEAPEPAEAKSDMTVMAPQLTDQYYRLRVQGEAPEAVRRHDGQTMQRFSFLDSEEGFGLLSLAGRPDEGVGVRVPAAWLVALIPVELAHARWLDHTFFERERYVTEGELAGILCRSCKGSGLVAQLRGSGILVTRETRAQLEADGAVVTECDECHGLGVSGPEAASIMSAEAVVEQ